MSPTDNNAPPDVLATSRALAWALRRVLRTRRRGGAWRTTRPSVPGLEEASVVEDHHAVAVAQRVLELLVVVLPARRGEDTHARDDAVMDVLVVPCPIRLHDEHARV